MNKLEYDEDTYSLHLPGYNGCAQIVSSIAHLLLIYSDCRSLEHRAYIVDQIARRVFQGQYEVFLRRNDELNRIPWDHGIEPGWEGCFDEFGEPIYRDGELVHADSDEAQGDE